MSKSLGNFFTVRDLLEQGVLGEVMRFVFLSTHYRKPMDWTEKKAKEAEATLRKWRTLCDGIEPAVVAAPVLAALADDLNTAGAITEMHKLAAAGDAGALKASAKLMGLLLPEWDAAFNTSKLKQKDQARLDRLVMLRSESRAKKDFTKSDQIRDGLAALGVTLNDAQGASNWNVDGDLDSDALLKLEEALK